MFFLKTDMIVVKWILLLGLSVWVSRTTSQVHTVRQGLQNKFFSAKQQLTNSFYQHSIEMNKITLVTSKLWTVSFDDIYPKIKPSLRIPWITRIGSNMLVLSSKKVWGLARNGPFEKASLPEDFPQSLHFVKNIKWQNQVFLLACLEDFKCSLFTSSLEFDFLYRQDISDDSGHLIDAEFFVHHGALFLIVLFRALNAKLSQTRMYYWRNTFLDPELDTTEIISTASSITAFNYGERILFVLGCSGDDKLKFMSQVWSREADGQMKKIQYLPTSNPLSITHFVEKGEHFVLVQEQNQSPSIYYWEGSELVRWMELEDKWKYFKVFVSKNITYLPTFLIFTHGNSVNIYSKSYKTLKKVFEADEFLSNENLPQNLSIKTMTLYEEVGEIYMLVHATAGDKDYLTLFLVAINPILVTTVTELPFNGQTEKQGALKDVLNRVTELQAQESTLGDIMNTLLFSNRQAVINRSDIRVPERVKMQSGEIWSLIHRNMDISGFIQYIYSRVSPITKEINMKLITLQSTLPYRNRHIFFFHTVHLKQAKINSIRAYTVNNKPFKPESFLSVKQKQKLLSIKAKTLEVDWLVAKQIGNKSVEGVLLEDNIIRGHIQVNQLEAKNLEMSANATINSFTAIDFKNKAFTVDRRESSLNKEGVMAKKPSVVTTLQLQDHSVIQNLNVEFINDIHVNNLFNSLYNNKNQTVINGSLYFKDAVKVNELVYKRLTEHNVESTNPYVKSLPSRNTDVQYLPEAQYFPGRGIVKRDTSHDTRPVKIYKNKVKILGNLKVRHLIFENSSLTTSSGIVPTVNIEKEFWTHNTPQVIPGAVHFTQEVTLLQGLDFPIVNNKNLSQYGSTRSMFRSLVLENVHVDGNISSNSSHFLIKRSLDYDVLEVKHIHTEYINGTDMKKIVHMGHLVNSGMNIITENLHVKGDLQADFVNGIDIKQKFENAVLINEDFTTDKLTLTNISAKIVEVKYLNNYQTDELEGFRGLGVHGSRVFQGNLSVSQLFGVKFVNQKPVNLSLVVNSSKNTVIYGKKNFLSQVKILNDINVTSINNVNVEKMFRDLLTKSSEQEVTGFYVIKKASMKSLENISEINYIDPSKFVYIDQPQVNLTSDLNFTSLLVEGNLTAASLPVNCVLPKVEEQTVFEQASTWASLKIIGDSEWSKASSKSLLRLLKSAVTVNGYQLITGNVFAEDMSVEAATIHTLNNKNLTFVIQDALLRNKEHQVITGKKHFPGSFKCENLEAKGSVRFDTVNNLDINDIDMRLVRSVIDHDAPNNPVSGHKTFMSGFKTFHLTCPDGINGIRASALVTEKYNGVLPPLVVHSLNVFMNLQVNTVNGLHIASFLKDCVYKNYTGIQLLRDQFHVIGNLFLEGNVTTSSINNISNQDLVFVKDEKAPVVIKDCKTFSTNMQIETDFEVSILNGVNLIETYKNSIKKNQNATINGSMVLLSAVDMDTIYALNYVVNSKPLINLTQTIAP